MSPSLRRLSIAALTLALSACAADKAEVNEDFTDLVGQDQKADYFSYRLKLLGTLTDGASKRVLYKKTPRFRGFEFAGAAGDQLEVWVRSTHGDPVTWILDGSFRVVAKNDDADDSTYDSHLVITLPASTVAPGRYYVVFRDYDLASHWFTVDLHHRAGDDSSWDDAAREQVERMVDDYGSLSAFAVAPSAMPAAARERHAVSGSVLEVPTTYQLDVAGRDCYLVVVTDGSGEGNIVVVDLVDGAGRWFAHGVARSLWDGGGFGWSLDEEDPTMCQCGTDGPGTCTWMDGSTADTPWVCES